MCNENVKLIFFSSKLDVHAEKISKVVPASLPEESIFRCNTINDFSILLRNMLFGLSILLVVVRDKEELNEIYQFKERLKDHSMILILADDIDDMDHQAIRIYPRYTTYLKNDYKDVSQILSKMIHNIENKIKGESNDEPYRFN